jgi:phospholipid N-methyltransferase
LHCCEINPVLAQDARQNLARAGVNGNVHVHTVSAQALLAELDRKAPAQPAFVISALPIGNLKRSTVLELLRASKDALAPNGMFIQVQHFLVDRKNIRAIFRDVRIVPVLRNLPPGFVYYARK